MVWHFLNIKSYRSSSFLFFRAFVAKMSYPSTLVDGRALKVLLESVVQKTSAAYIEFETDLVKFGCCRTNHFRCHRRCHQGQTENELFWFSTVEVHRYKMFVLRICDRRNEWLFTEGGAVCMRPFSFFLEKHFNFQRSLMRLFIMPVVTGRQRLHIDSSKGEVEPFPLQLGESW